MISLPKWLKNTLIKIKKYNNNNKLKMNTNTKEHS
jgi:hypothetical protein